MSNEQQSTICVGGPKDGQWIPSSGDSVGERVFFPVCQYTLAELASAFHIHRQRILTRQPTAASPTTE